MSSGSKHVPPRPAPRLTLVTPPADDAGALAHALAEALAAADIAAVVLHLAETGEREQINQAKALAKTVQDGGAALLLYGHPELVARSGADGAHLAHDFAGAIPTLKPDRIAGAGGLASRHDAMVAAEAGADYVMFGEPDESGVRPPMETITERLTWWSEVFEAPCVGYAATMDEITTLVAAGADFVALDPSIWFAAPGTALATATRHLTPPEQSP